MKIKQSRIAVAVPVIIRNPLIPCESAVMVDYNRCSYLVRNDSDSGALPPEVVLAVRAAVDWDAL